MLASESFKPTAMMAYIIFTVQYCIPTRGLCGSGLCNRRIVYHWQGLDTYMETGGPIPRFAGS